MSDKIDNTKDTLDDLLVEERLFHPNPEFTKNAVIKNTDIYESAENNPLEYWEKCAEQLDWFKPWHTVLEWKAPHAKWFLGGKLNASYNCLDRHIKNGKGEKTAFLWEGESGEQKVISYQTAYDEVNKFANVLKYLGISKGDRVAIYMPMIPEAAYAMLACARIGAIHTVIFGGFSVDSLKDRIQDAQAKLLITADGGYRRGKIIPLKKTSDDSVKDCPSIEHLLVVQRTKESIGMVEGRDHWYHELKEKVDAYCEPEEMDSEDKLFILYTSGTTGKPKGIVHTTGGYMTHVTSTSKMVFDLNDEDIFWCTADVGWVTGHSYIVYGPMANGATQIIFEGTPDFPNRDRFWKIIEKYRATIFYTAPTAIRSFMKWGDEYPKSCDLSSLRLLGTVGEPINPEAWVWYHHVIGREHCPIVDTWWQTETGGIMISPLPGIISTKPGSATKPLPGISIAIKTEEGEDIDHGGGILSITQPWPSMLRGIWGDEKRFIETYWSKFENSYFPGDGAKRDKDGYLWLLGRVDDIMLIAGHNISTMEVESALVDHHIVAESAVVAIHDDLKGQAIAAFVTLREGNESSPEIEKELINHVAEVIGSIAKPKKILFTADLPKTRSGKIMRRLLRDIAEGRALGDVTTLADPAVVDSLIKKYDECEK